MRRYTCALLEFFSRLCVIDIVLQELVPVSPVPDVDARRPDTDTFRATSRMRRKYHVESMLGSRYQRKVISTRW